MKQTIEHYISNLLYLHDCVIIPGFGGFVGAKISAYIHPVSEIIYPPSKTLLFNKNLTQNDGLLATHIAKEEGLDLSEITDLIEEFVQEIQKELKNRSAFKLKKVGNFTMGKEGNISFMQDKDCNYNLASFGMEANHKSEKVDRTISDEKEVIVKTIRQKDLNKPLKRAAAVLIPLIGLSLISIIHEEGINDIYIQMANLNPFSNSKTEIVKEDPIKEIEVPIVEVIETEKVEILTPTIAKQYTYYIIAGAFAEQKNANNLVQKLKSQNYDASIVEGGNLMRVSYNSFLEKEQAIMALAEIRKTNKSAWLLTK